MLPEKMNAPSITSFLWFETSAGLIKYGQTNENANSFEYLILFCGGN